MVVDPGSMVAAWFAVILASGAFSLEFASSGRWADFLSVLGWMTLVHAGIGLGEALITGLVLRFVLLPRPDLIHDAEAAPTSRPVRWGQVLVAGLGIALAGATILAPFASEDEDGLEWVGGKLGLLKVGSSSSLGSASRGCSPERNRRGPRIAGRRTGKNRREVGSLWERLVAWIPHVADHPGEPP